MLSFLLFAPEPRRLVNVGLGGGSLAKWIYRNLPRVEQVVLEINPRVIACARQYFHLPPDGSRLRVIAADGSQWVSRHTDCTDVIVVDGYDGRAQSAELTTTDFYADAARCMHASGMLVVNLWGNDRRFDDYLKRIEGAFDGQVCCVPAAQRGNIIVLAFKSRPVATRWDELRDQAHLLQRKYGVEFPEFVEAMKRLNPHTARRLLI
jgi:spermidine synthase